MESTPPILTSQTAAVPSGCCQNAVPSADTDTVHLGRELRWSFAA